MTLETAVSPKYILSHNLFPGPAAPICSGSVLCVRIQNEAPGIKDLNDFLKKLNESVTERLFEELI